MFQVLREAPNPSVSGKKARLSWLALWAGDGTDRLIGVQQPLFICHLVEKLSLQTQV